MPTTAIVRSASMKAPSTPDIAPIRINPSDGKMYLVTAGVFGTTEREIPFTDSGMVVTKSVRFVENGAATSYTGTIAVPAGAVIRDITVIAEALWNGTSATGKVGDSVDDDGFFIGINLKAADLLVGEVLSVMHSTLWGGKEGAYLVAATGQRGPVATNFGMYYAAGSNLKMIVTPGAADGTLGRTIFTVSYSIGEVTAQVTV